MPTKLIPSWLRASYRRWQQRGMNVRSWQALAEQPEFQNASLAIVGNAGYLADRQQGTQIDGHDLVLRMNNCVTAGHEAEVGRRTDVFLSTFWQDIRLDNPAIQDARFLIAAVPNNFAKPPPLQHRHGEPITAAMLNLKRKEVFAPAEAYFAEKCRQIGRYPTTGAMAIFLAMEHLLPVCSSVSITGFSFFAGRSHYFSDRDVVPTNHDMQAERAVLQEVLAPHLTSGRVTLDPIMVAALQLPFISSMVNSF